MTTDPYAKINTRQTPQTEKADPAQVKNNADGHSFAVTPIDQFKRFLILGSAGGSYYTGEDQLTKDNVEVLKTLPAQEAVDVLREISVAGRAPKQNPTIFALAYLCSVKDPADRAYALTAVNDVVRTGTHLFLFVKYLKQFRGWGRGAKRAVSQWYTGKTSEDLAYQMLKYKNREGYTHRDVLRLAHPIPPTSAHSGLFQWAVGKGLNPLGTPGIVSKVEDLHENPSLGQALALISLGSVSWEMLPTELLNRVEVWEALIDSKALKYNALVRQLPRLTTLGVDEAKVLGLLKDKDLIGKSRIHPMQILNALVTYQSGISFRGSSTWTPNPKYIDALDEAFYTSFGNVAPSGKRTMLALDVSGSMSWDKIAGMNLTPAQGSAAMALVTAATEPNYQIMAFSHTLVPITISPRQRLDDVVRELGMITMGRTDCSQPMLYALEKGLEIDTFVIYTDNETWAGSIHPHQALKKYREATGVDARLVVVGMTATGFTIADPSDSGMLDIVGFDSATPNLISEFSAGRV